jgi:hypothetical protein
LFNPGPEAGKNGKSQSVAKVPWACGFTAQIRAMAKPGKAFKIAKITVSDERNVKNHIESASGNPKVMNRKPFFWPVEAMILFAVASIPIHIDERHKNQDHCLLGGNCGQSANDAKLEGDQSELTVNLARLDVVADVLRAAAIDLAADGESSTEDLKDGTLELLGERARAHLTGNLNNLVEGDGLGVLDVLLLLAVTRRLLESLDDKGRGGGHNRNLSLTVLDGETDGNTETLL